MAHEARLVAGRLAIKLQLAGLVSLDRIGVAKVESRIRSVYDYESIVIADTLGVSPGALAPEDDEVVRSLPRLTSRGGDS